MARISYPKSALIAPIRGEWATYGEDDAPTAWLGCPGELDGGDEGTHGQCMTSFQVDKAISVTGNVDALSCPDPNCGFLEDIKLDGWDRGAQPAP
jgi:hypothetical protein